MANPLPIIEQNYTIPVIGGSTVAVNNLGASSTQVITSAPARKNITFHNPNVAGNVNVLVCQAQDSAGNTLTASFSAPGGGFVLFPGSSLIIEGDAAQSAWLAVAQSGSSNGLTVVSSQK